MASNFLALRLRREPGGTYGLQELAAGGRCSHGLFSTPPCLPSPPSFKVVIISLFIHMQAVVLDGNRLCCGRSSPQPPASLCPSFPCPPRLHHLPAARCCSPAPPCHRRRGDSQSLTLYQGQGSEMLGVLWRGHQERLHLAHGLLRPS